MSTTSVWTAPKVDSLTDVAGLMAYQRWYDERVRQISELAYRGGAYLRSSKSLERKLRRAVRALAVELVPGLPARAWQYATDKSILQDLAHRSIEARRVEVSS